MKILMTTTAIAGAGVIAFVLSATALQPLKINFADDTVG